jgi:uncharacterized protein DUF6429
MVPELLKRAKGMNLQCARSPAMMDGAAMGIDTDRIDDCVLALLLLGRHDGQRVWKSFDWDAMGRLHDNGLISDPVGRAKSVTLTNEGLQRAERLFGELFAKKA